MVTAILIPIICIYFYWLTKKEMKESNEKWLNLNNIEEEAILSGKLLTLREEKQRYYYHRYVYVIEMKIQTETKTQMAKRIFPLTKSFTKPELKTGSNVKLYGNWKGKEGAFQVSRIEVLQD